MVIPSNRSGSFPQSQAQTYDWRTFLLEFLYGVLTIAWLLLALLEMSVLKGLTRLEKLARSSSDDPGNNSGGAMCRVMIQNLRSSCSLTRLMRPVMNANR